MITPICGVKQGTIHCHSIKPNPSKLHEIYLLIDEVTLLPSSHDP